MMLGSGLTYFLLRDRTKAPVPAESALPSEAVTSISPPPGKLETQLRRENAVLDDAQFEAAVSRARAARKAGTLQPLATTPDEFARALGSLNYRIYQYAVRYATPPPDGSPQEAEAQREMQQLLEALANLFSDDAVLAKLDESSAVDLARAQSFLAAGALELDSATTMKVAEILAKSYAEALPQDLVGKELTPEQEAELDRKLAAGNEKVVAEITALLTPEQKTRFDSLGADQVLFGLRTGEE